MSWPALVPPLLTVVLALATRRLLASLAVAVVVGAMILHGPIAGIGAVVTDYGLRNATDTWHLYILGFTLCLLGMVEVIGSSGGTLALVESLGRFVRSPRMSRLVTSMMGVVVFFDDYANCMLVGASARPLTDRFRVAREKLAYLVDSTAAPVAGLIPLSTWVGYEVGLLDDVSRQLSLNKGGYPLLLAALPFRFYCVLTLVFVFASSGLGRDFGPMLRAERRAAGGRVFREGSRPASSTKPANPGALGNGTASHAVVPMLALVATALAGFVADGGGIGRLSESPLRLLSFGFWGETLAASENNVAVLCLSAAVGAALAMALPVLRKTLSPTAAASAFARGIRSSAYAVGILLLAWALAAVCKDLGTGRVVVGLLGDSLSPAAVPLATFCTAAAIAFATGTSWGTMAMVIPVAVPLAHGTGDPAVLVITVAAVLDGAIFGDHCSPISDTTLMSSIASGSDHIDHVVTQLPYAMTTMVVALLAGYVPATRGVSSWIASLFGALAVIAVLFVFGRRSDR